MPYKSRPISTVPEPSEYMCGVGSWRPQWLQSCVSTRMFLFIFGVMGVIQGASFAYFIASITTLERRYAFGSTISGLILIADNLTELAVGPLLGYLANRIHRPRMIGYCQVIVALGCYLAALPYFIYGPNDHTLSASGQGLANNIHNNKSVEFCDQNRFGKNDCQDTSATTTIIPAVVMLWAASFCNGLGTVAFYTIGIPFIDDSVKKKNSPLYLGMTGALRLCGPTLAFMLSSYCLTFYENPLVDPGIKPGDPRWVGAWWIGFVVIGTVLLIVTIPMFFFPRSFKMNANIYRQSNGKPLVKQTAKTDQITVWMRTKRLLKNPIYVCYVLGTTARLFAVLGYLTFKSKYIETQYKTSASKANFFSGIIGVIPTATGIFLGGLFIRKFLPGPKVLTTLITIVEIIGAMGMFSALFLGCPQSEFAGTRLDSHFEMQSMCNDNCFCSEKEYQPICGPDDKTNYFSPCFAGCRTQSINISKKYSNCDCFEGSATEGYCETDCGNNFHIYITLLGISNIIGSLAKAGNSIISFRIVAVEDKSFAAGLMTGFMCLFAFIPYPLVYGAVIDASCLIWDSSCGQRGNCWMYDTNALRLSLHGLTLVMYFTGSLFDIIVIFLSKRIKNLYNDDIDEEEESPVNMKLSSSVDRQLSTLFD